MLSGGAVSWRSRKQTCVALSTAEAEYVALTNTSQEVIWMRQLMEDLQSQQVNSIVVYSICSYLFSTIIFIDVLKTANIVNKT